ncbi:ASKHA domain-containing protein [Hathewaya histolytica]|uniref:Ferredoxin-containing protein n=2 Tax=Hathewaya histolytica TaxID=1498 RepID=A0A4U9QX36_HATHI|nr:ASKHA domain-containing protein [Hathewaya histolytica]VTQ83404.1 ferredoxin-containing protein [Hathewaya histolytica]
MDTIKVYPEGKVIEYRKGEKLLDILQDSGVILESPCGGNGTCGKCKVKILSGEFNEITEEEKRRLKKEELENGVRLSCLITPKGNVEVELLNAKSKKHKILSEGYIPNFKLGPTISKEVITLEKPTLENNISYEELLEKTLGKSVKLQDPEFLQELSNSFIEETATVVYSGEEIIGIEKGDTRDKLYGAAVDIGTTTVVLSLIDLTTGLEVGAETAINPQKEYGLDVLSRIEFVKKKPEGRKILHRAIINCLNELLESLCDTNHIDIENVYEICIGANATMMHLLLDIDTRAIGKSPYATVFSREKYLYGRTIGLKGSKFNKLYCLPGVSSYIGADIVAGAVVSRLKHTNENILFIDIGTNGEIILSKKGELTSCSCAAGPALEGANISCGMRAAEGAIEGIQISKEDGRVDIQVIADEKPVGICGSGILEVIAELWENRIIVKSGRIKKASDLEKEGYTEVSKRVIEEDKKRKFVILEGEEPIVITQEDIRQVQLAKGAISSGFYALLDLMEITMDDLQKVVIAGQFGKHLKISSLTGTGIIPEKLRDRIEYIGNSSKTGALMCLLSKDIREEMEKTAKDIKYFELSTKEGYEKLFTKCITF